MRVLGVDPSLSNLGIVTADLDIGTNRIEVVDMKLVSTKPGGEKGAKVSSLDLLRAMDLATGLQEAAKSAVLGFFELPTGSQGARAMASYGICIGLVASLEMPIIQVTPSEVKKIAVGHSEASKEEMIEWAVALHPEAQWLRRGGRLVGKNEHLADALAAIYAGLKSPQYQNAMLIYKSAGVAL